MKNMIKNYITNIAHIDNLEDNQNLFDSGLLTSLDILDVINFLEQKFNITFSDNDIDAESFNTVNHMALLIENVKNKEGKH